MFWKLLLIWLSLLQAAKLGNRLRVRVFVIICGCLVGLLCVWLLSHLFSPHFLSPLSPLSLSISLYFILARPFSLSLRHDQWTLAQTLPLISCSCAVHRMDVLREVHAVEQQTFTQIFPKITTQTMLMQKLYALPCKNEPFPSQNTNFSPKCRLAAPSLCPFFSVSRFVVCSNFSARRLLKCRRSSTQIFVWFQVCVCACAETEFFYITYYHSAFPCWMAFNF